MPSLSAVSKPFEQESQDVTRQYGGSGLGMSITDHLVHLMGGEILIDRTARTSQLMRCL